jgi:Superfamily I DNA and RNA helicases
MVVGDPDQSIYGWRGADMNMILNFERDFPGAKTVLLDQNYRSTSRILGASNGLIRNNLKRKPKNLWTARDKGDPVKIVLHGDEKQEAAFVLSEIENLRRKGYRYGQVALLYRVNALSRTYEQALLGKGIPYRVVRGMAFYERKEVKDVLSFLRLALNPADAVSLSRIANVPPKGLGKKGIEELAACLSFDPGARPS